MILIWKLIKQIAVIVSPIVCKALFFLLLLFLNHCQCPNRGKLFLSRQKSPQNESNIAAKIHTWVFENWHLVAVYLIFMSQAVWPDWAIYWTLGNFLKPLATFNLLKSPTSLGNFCKDVKIYHFPSEIILGNFYRYLAIFFWSHWS